VIGRPAPVEVAEITSEPRRCGSRAAKPVQEIDSAFTEPVSVEVRETTAPKLVNVGLEDPLLRSRAAAASGHRGS